jgi:hypothetical protein
VHAHRLASEEAGVRREPRSWLFVPADSEKKIAKAMDSDADASSSTLRTASPGKQGAPRGKSSSTSRTRSGGPQWWVRINPIGSDYHKDDLELISRGDIAGHRPAQGRKRRRRHPARAPHRQHPDSRDRHRDRGQPVHPAVLPRSQSRRWWR